jgi:alpha-amylase
VDFFDHGYLSLINFAFKRDAAAPADSLFAAYAAAVRGPLRGLAILNYVSSHDDGSPYDPDREDPFGAGTRLLLAPGGAQIYYGDELARPLRVPGAEGDANLRSSMNWGDLEAGGRTREVLEHWRRLGRFRHAHPAVGAGEHRALQERPYVFSRTLRTADGLDRIVVALDHDGARTIPVGDVFADGTDLRDAYSGVTVTVSNGSVTVPAPSRLVLLAVTPESRRSPAAEAGGR